MFRVGQKVVCVDDKPRAGYRLYDCIKRGRVFEIVALRKTVFGADGIVVNVGPDWAYRASRFRPIVDRPTDISVFKEMLHPSKIAEACDV